MEFPAAIVDVISSAKCIKAVPLTRMHLPCKFQRIRDLAELFQSGCIACQFQFLVKESEVKRGVMDDQFRSSNEVEKLIHHFRKRRLTLEEVFGDAMDLLCLRVNSATWVQIGVKPHVGVFAVAEKYTAELDYAVSLCRIETGRFRIQHNQVHAVVPPV